MRKCNYRHMLSVFYLKWYFTWMIRSLIFGSQSKRNPFCFSGVRLLMKRNCFVPSNALLATILHEHIQQNLFVLHGVLIKAISCAMAEIKLFLLNLHCWVLRPIFNLSWIGRRNTPPNPNQIYKCPQKALWDLVSLLSFLLTGHKGW